MSSAELAVWAADLEFRARGYRPQRWISPVLLVDGQMAGGAGRAGSPGAVVDRPSPRWGLAARGALVEAGGPIVDFDLDDRAVVWADVAPRLYAQAAAGQCDPATAIDWDAPRDHPADVESAVVQLMTFLVENEQWATTRRAEVGPRRRLHRAVDVVPS